MDHTVVNIKSAVDTVNGGLAQHCASRYPRSTYSQVRSTYFVHAFITGSAWFLQAPASLGVITTSSLRVGGTLHIFYVFDEESSLLGVLPIQSRLRLRPSAFTRSGCGPAMSPMFRSNLDYGSRDGYVCVAAVAKNSAGWQHRGAGVSRSY
jgi:hypothetical protein